MAAATTSALFFSLVACSVYCPSEGWYDSLEWISHTGTRLAHHGGVCPRIGDLNAVGPLTLRIVERTAQGYCHTAQNSEGELLNIPAAKLAL